jgi:hypothetical protein
VVLDKVQAAIRERQTNIYAWVLLEKIRDDGKKIEPPKRDGRGQEQLALGHPILAGCFTLSRIRILNDAAAGNEERSSRFRRHNLPVRSRQQPRLHVRFELRDLAADRS